MPNGEGQSQYKTESVLVELRTNNKSSSISISLQPAAVFATHPKDLTLSLALLPKALAIALRLFLRTPSPPTSTYWPRTNPHTPFLASSCTGRLV